MMKRVLAMLLALCLVLSAAPGVSAREQQEPVTLQAQEIEEVPSFSEQETEEPAYPEDAMVTVIVELRSEPVLEKAELPQNASMSAGASVAAYLASAQAVQRAEALRAEQQQVIRQFADDLDGQAFMQVASWTSLVNGVAVRVPYSALPAIRSNPAVKRAYVQRIYTLPAEPEAIGSEDAVYGYSYDMVGLESVWNAGYTGKNMLVAVMDTGLDLSWAYWNDAEGNHIGVRHVHEAFTGDSFRSSDAKDSLRYTEADMKAFLESHSLYANNQFNKNDGIWKNDKVPFAYDYAGTIDYETESVYGDVNVYPGIGGSEHGTHVAGTVAGYAETAEGQVLFSGVAPDAQIAALKVFSDDGGSAYEVCIINALEDAVALGADAVNMSFGSDNGFAFDDTAEYDAFRRAREAGVLMLTSAGNSDFASSGNNYGGESLAGNPDTAMMSSPAIYDSNLAVASINNTVNSQSSLAWYVGGEKQGDVPFTDSTEIAMKYQFAGKSPVKMILVEGVGTYEDYVNAGFMDYYGSGSRGVSGVALVRRGEISFADKVANAARFTWSYFSVAQGKYVTECPVKAVIVYDSDPKGTDLIVMNTGEYTSVTSAFISGMDGEAIAEQLRAGKNVTMNVNTRDSVIPFASAYELSEFTSWGAGPGLELKPEITAPGGNIYSSVFDQAYNYNAAGQFTNYRGAYTMMSGTSMAAPHMTGITALVEQYLQQGRGMTDRGEIADLASRLMVSTAVPQLETETAFWSPRVQGAGLVNVAAAIETPAYLTVEGQSVGKIELLDDPQRTGTYALNFNVVNYSDAPVRYQVWVYVQRPGTGETEDGRTTMSYTDELLSRELVGQITVPAHSEVPVSHTVQLTEQQKAQMDAAFSNGCYVEGFVTLTAEDAPAIGLPFLGFYGDWTAAPLFDSALWFDAPEDGESVWNNDRTWEVSDIACMEPGSGIPVLLGQNYFDPTTVGMAQQVFHKENFTLSPNGDGVLDQIDIFELYQLRSARLIVVQVRDAETDELYYHDYVDYVSMSTYKAAYGMAFPWSLSYFTATAWDGTDLNGKQLPSGTNCVMTVTAYGDGDYGELIYVDEVDRPVTDFGKIDPADPSTAPTFNGHAMDMTGDVISFPIVVDTVAPKLRGNAVTFYEENGRTYISATVEDVDGSIASVEVHPYVARTYAEGVGDPNYIQYGMDENNPFYSENIYDAGTKTLTFTADVSEYVHDNEAFPGESEYYSYTWTGNLILSCGDYGINDRTYVIHVDTTEGLVLSQTCALLHVGDKFDLSVNNNTGSSEYLTRTSSSPEVASVDEFGHVEALSVGQTTITVTDGVHSAVCIVAVEDYHTEVLDFKLSLEQFSGLKPDGAIVVRITDVQPADVVITENRWEVFEDDEDWAGLLNVEKYSADGRTGMIYLNYAYSEELIPAGSGHLTVTLNGVSRTMEFDWEDVYLESEADGLVADISWQGEQTVYVTQGETAVLSAKYRNAYNHSASKVRLYADGGAVNYGYTNTTDPAAGLVLDGSPIFLNGGTWQGKLVNLADYSLPGSIRVFTRYDNGYEIEATEGYYRYGVSFEYSAETGEITVWNCPYGASNELVFRADGVAAPGNAAGTLSGAQYDIPDPVDGPFLWSAADGHTLTGELTTAEGVDVGDGNCRNVALYTPAEPGVSYLTAMTKDGRYSLNMAVICLPVAAEKVNVEEKHVSVHVGKTAQLSAVLSPEPTLEKDRGLLWSSFNEDVLTVDETGCVNAVAPGYAYVKVCAETLCTVQSYVIVEVTDHDWHGQVTVPATERTGGVMTYTCAVCGETYTEVIPVRECPSAVFTDVTAKWYHDAVDDMLNRGLMKGIGENTFAPMKAMSRAEVATVLWRMAGSPKPQGECPFTDVPKWARTACTWAAEAGVTNGTSAGKFSPNVTVTRETVAALLFRFDGENAEKADLSSFPDAGSVHSWARSAVQWAVANGYLKGTGSGLLNPRGEMSRAEVAVLLSRYLAD